MEDFLPPFGDVGCGWNFGESRSSESNLGLWGSCLEGDIGILRLFSCLLCAIKGGTHLPSVSAVKHYLVKDPKATGHGLKLLKL